MHMHKGKWYHAVLAELERQGFEPGGLAVPHLVSSWVRSGVTVEVRGGNMLRVLRAGREDEYRCDLGRAMRIIAELTGPVEN